MIGTVHAVAVDIFSTTGFALNGIQRRKSKKHSWRTKVGGTHQRPWDVIVNAVRQPEHRKTRSAS